MSTAAVWSNVRATCTRLGIDVSDVAAELVDLEDDLRAAASVSLSDPADVGAALVECGRKGTDPAEHPTIVRAAVAALITERAPGAVRVYGARRQAELLAEAAPRLLAALAEVVTESQATIARAIAEGVPLAAVTDRGHALRADLETPAALARDAVAAAEAAVSAWRSLVGAIGPTVPAHHGALVAADLSAEAYDALPKPERSKVSAVVAAGHALELPADVAAYRVRVKRITEEHAAARARRERDESKAHSIHRGAPVVV